MSGEWLFTQNYNKNIMVKKEEEERKKTSWADRRREGSRSYGRNGKREKNTTVGNIILYIIYIYLLDLKEGEWKNVL